MNFVIVDLCDSNLGGSKFCINVEELSCALYNYLEILYESYFYKLKIDVLSIL